jgi:primary-amine oxidase
LVIVDLHQQAVISIEDLPTHNSFDATDNIGNVVPRTNHNWDYQLRGGEHFLRQDDKPIKIVSPAGASYKVTGNQIEWQKWKMRLGFNGREGPIIYTVSYKDKSSIHRPILYRASLVEMFIPYGDPRPPFHRKAVFDVGQYGIGFYGDRQRLDKDVLGAATMFQGVLNNITGSPVQFPNVISLTEEDDGILWKHVDINTGKGAVVRSHRLVLSFIATVGNYDYIFIWRFTQDASIQFEVRLTGVVQTNMLAVGATPSGFGSSVASQVDAQYHQHYFSVRIDAEIDGNRNSVYMADSVQLKSPTGSPGKQKYRISY